MSSENESRAVPSSSPPSKGRKRDASKAAKHRRTNATDSNSDTSSDSNDSVRESCARSCGKGGPQVTTKPSIKPSAGDAKQGQKHRAAQNADGQSDQADSKQKSSDIAKNDCRDHVNEKCSEKKPSAKQKNESDTVKKMPVDQQSHQIEEFSATESSLSNSDESSDKESKDNGYQRSASHRNAAKKDDRSGMRNVAEEQSAERATEHIKCAQNTGTQGSASTTQKQIASKASAAGGPAGQAKNGEAKGFDEFKVGGMFGCKSKNFRQGLERIKKVKICPHHKIPKNQCPHSKDDKNYWRRGPCLLPRTPKSGLAQCFLQESSCAHQVSGVKPASVEESVELQGPTENRERALNAGRQTPHDRPVRSGLSHTVCQLLPEGRKNAQNALESSGDNTNTEESSDEIDSSTAKGTANEGKEIGGGRASVNAAARPRAQDAGEGNLVVERANITPMKTWFGFGIRHSQFLKNVRTHLGLADPSPLISLAMPLLREGYDIKCITNGKIAATDFVITAVERLLAEQWPPTTVLRNGVVAPLSLILTKDLERCEEFYAAAKKATRKLDVKARRSHAKCHPGTNVEDMQRGCHLLCVTVARAGLLHDIGAISFENVRYVLIDDVDKLHEEHDFLSGYLMKSILGASDFPDVSQRVTVLHMPPSAEKAVRDAVKAALKSSHAIICEKD